MSKEAMGLMKKLTQAQQDQLILDMLRVEKTEEIQDTQYFNRLDQQAEEATINSIVSQARA